MSQSPTPPVLPSRVPDEVYTDRQEFLDSLYQTALLAREQRSMSRVLLGQRRLGKTEIFMRVVNRLFWGQDHRDPQAVVPVFYTFGEDPGDRWEFSIAYVENILRWYAAFRLREPEILKKKAVLREDLVDLVKSRLPITQGVKGILNVIQFFREGQVTTPEEEAVITPVQISDFDGTPMAVFLDEFQNTRLPDSNVRILTYMQKAGENAGCFPALKAKRIQLCFPTI